MAERRGKQARHSSNPLSPRVCKMLVVLERCRNMGEAAARLGVLQSVLSRQLAGVEQSLGVRLFARTTRSMEPTEEGVAIVRQAARILASLDRIRDDLAAIGRGSHGHLRLGVASVAAAVLMPQAVATFRRQRPGVEFAIRDDTNDRLLDDLAMGRLDAAVLRLPKGGHFQFEKTVLYDEPIRVVVRGDHPLAGRSEVGWDELAGHDWILPSSDNVARGQIEMFLDKAGLGFRAGIIETLSVPLIIGLVAATDAITVIADSLARRCVTTEGFAILPVECPLDLEPVSVVWQREDRPPPALAGFLDTLVQTAEAIGQPPARGQSPRARGNEHFLEPQAGDNG